jgi:hypothetical protein
MPSLTKQQFIIIGIVLIIIAIVTPSTYFYLQYRKSQQLLKNPTEAAKVENDLVISKVALLVDMPSGEQPTVATVSNKDQLANQPFFARAENNDKVLFYQAAKKAILYRPSTNKIIEMSAVNMTPPATQSSVTPSPLSTALTPTSTPAKSLRIVIYNGTTTPKLANNVETVILGKNPMDQVIKKDNAAKTDYPRTIVVDLTGTNLEASKTIAGVLSGDASTTLPAGEIKPEGDILVIVGKNYSPK